MRTDEMYFDFGKGLKAKVAPILLRDSCKCQECYNQATQERQRTIQHLDVSVKPESVVKDVDDQTITVSWSDQHKSIYTYQDIISIGASRHRLVTRSLWPPGFKPAIYEYDEIMRDNKALHSLTSSFLSDGLVQITD